MSNLKFPTMVSAMTGLSLLLVPNVSADTSGQFVLGYDNNPFKLSDALSPDEAMYLDVLLRWEQPIAAGFGVDLRANTTKFEQSSDDASQTTYSAALNYEASGVAWGHMVETNYRLRYTDQDQTYVSRITGQVGSFSGTDTPDRYDATRWEIRARADVTIDDHLSLRLQAEGRDKTYDDYTWLGLSNLNYAQFAGEATLRYRPNSANDIRVGGNYGERQYDDREGRDMTGTFVPGTNLEYTFAGFDASWKFDLTDRQDILGAYSYATREDNVSGYFDTTSQVYSVRYRRKVLDNQRVVAKLAYTDYSYDNLTSAAIIDNEEPVGPKEGFRSSLAYEYVLDVPSETEWTVFAEISHEDYDSANAAYTYSRTVGFIGIETRF